MGSMRVYFPGLNGIRAIAAMIVLIFHIDQYTNQYFHFEDMGIWQTGMQKYAVVMFFVLSGFLITFLLLTEKEKFAKVSYRKFYTRRILRIWPVYYLVLFVGMILLLIFQDKIYALPKDNNFLATFLFYFFLLSNVGFALLYRADLIGNLWSIGVEEQFYAFWPFFIGKVKNVFRFLVLLFGGYLLLKFLLVYVIPIPIKFEVHFEFIPFDHMMVGAIAAWLFYSKVPFLRYLYHPITQCAAWSFLFYSILVTPVNVAALRIYNWNMHAIIYAVLILNVATNPKTVITLQNKLFNFLGKISYGIYAYHGIVFFLLSLLLNKIFPGIESRIVKLLLLHALVIGCTIGVAQLSFRYYESIFLRLKDRFAKVRTNPSRLI